MNAVVRWWCWGTALIGAAIVVLDVMTLDAESDKIFGEQLIILVLGLGLFIGGAAVGVVAGRVTLSALQVNSTVERALSLRARIWPWIAVAGCVSLFVYLIWQQSIQGGFYDDNNVAVPDWTPADVILSFVFRLACIVGAIFFTRYGIAWHRMPDARPERSPADRNGPDERGPQESIHADRGRQRPTG